jgi:hypothetical protein
MWDTLDEPKTKSVLTKMFDPRKKRISHIDRMLRERLPKSSMKYRVTGPKESRMNLGENIRHLRLEMVNKQ